MTLWLNNHQYYYMSLSFVKTLLHANIQASKAALVRNYFYWHKIYFLRDPSSSLTLAQWYLTK